MYRKPDTVSDMSEAETFWLAMGSGIQNVPDAHPEYRLDASCASGTGTD